MHHHSVGVAATMIADREQRLLELASDGQAYRVRATDTGARHDPDRHRPYLRALSRQGSTSVQVLAAD
jgi:hypothetical protein